MSGNIRESFFFYLFFASGLGCLNIVGCSSSRVINVLYVGSFSSSVFLDNVSELLILSSCIFAPCISYRIYFYLVNSFSSFKLFWISSYSCMAVSPVFVFIFTYILRLKQTKKLQKIEHSKKITMIATFNSVPIEPEPKWVDLSFMLT